jgi:hypothetical protein
VCSALLSAIDEDVCRDPAAWPLLNACRPHVEAAFDRGLAQARGAVTSQVLVRLGLRIGLLLSEQGEFGLTAERERASVELARSALGEEHMATLEAMGDLAVTLSDQGVPARARELEEQALEARRRLLGEEHPDTLRNLQDVDSDSTLGTGASSRPPGRLSGSL